MKSLTAAPRVLGVVQLLCDVRVLDRERERVCYGVVVEVVALLQGLVRDLRLRVVLLELAKLGRRLGLVLGPRLVLVLELRGCFHWW